MNKICSLCCECGEKNLEVAVNYTKPPEGELIHVPKSQKYERCYLACNDCGHFFADHNINLDKVYERQYLENHYGDVDLLEKKFLSILNLPKEKSDNKNRVERIRNFFDSKEVYKKKLLDIGAGIGVFGQEMANIGWNVVGTELDELMVEHLRLNTQIKAIRSNLIDAFQLDLGTFDLITFNKVLEHVNNPIDLLSASLQYLNKSGYVYIEVPDVLAISEGQDREEFYIDHLHVFTKKSVTNMIENVGMKCVSVNSIREPSGKFTIFSFAKYV